MKRIIGTGLIALALVACDNETNPLTSPTGDGTPGGLTDNTIPAGLAGNLTRISYDGADTLTVEMWALDTGTFTATYERNPALDTAGYTGFSVQDDPLDRMFVALVASSTSGDLTAGVVADGGQFNRYFDGGFYGRSSAANLPTTGQVSYAGTYAGITNISAPGDNLDPVAPGTDPALIPGEPARTQGTIFLNVNFGDNAVNGVIYDRSFVDVGYGDLHDLALIETNIDANGEFLGVVEFDGRPEDGTQGSYGGIFGGPDGAGEVAGVISLTNIFLSDDVRDTNFDAEVGVFVLPQCGTPGAPAVCDQVN